MGGRILLRCEVCHKSYWQQRHLKKAQDNLCYECIERINRQIDALIKGEEDAINKV